MGVGPQPPTPGKTSRSRTNLSSLSLKLSIVLSPTLTEAILPLGKVISPVQTLCNSNHPTIIMDQDQIQESPRAQIKL